LQEKLENLNKKSKKVKAAYNEASKNRLEMENKVSDNQIEVGSLIAELAKDIGNHLEDMNVWKVFLKQKTTYASENIQNLTRTELEELGYDETFTELENKLEVENAMLVSMYQEQLNILLQTQKTQTFNRAPKKGRAIKAGTSRPLPKGEQEVEPVQVKPDARKKRDRKSSVDTKEEPPIDKKKKRKRST